jgi:hypothetical protein
MSQVRFLFDECTANALVEGLQRREPAIDAIRVGQLSAPPRGTKDPELLMAAQALGRTLVSNDRSSMPDHLVAHFAGGHHTWGVVLMKEGYPVGRYIDELLTIWTAMTAEELQDSVMYIPF